MHIHCNLCAIAVSKTVIAFITSCSHIFCQRCLRAATKHTCPLCKGRSAAIPLNKTMPKKVMIVFMVKVSLHITEVIKIRRFRLLQFRILQLNVERRVKKHTKMKRHKHNCLMVKTHPARIAKVREMRLEIRTRFR